MLAHGESLADAISSLSAEHVERLKVIASGDANIDCGLVKSAIRDFIWELLEQFPEQKSDVSDMLTIMHDAIWDEHNS